MDNPKKITLKTRIVGAAREVLLKDGYRNFSMRKIARMIDVSATSIYLHFESKDALIHALMEKSIERLNQRMEASIASKQDPLQKLDTLAHEYVRFAIKNPREYQIIYLISTDEMARYPQEKFRRARKGYEIVISVLKEGVKARLISEKKPEIAAYTFWAQLHGVMSVVLSKRLDVQIDQQEFVEEAIGHILKGYQIRTSLKQNKKTA